MRKKRKRRKQGSEDSAISSVNGKKVNEMEYVYAAMLLHSAGKTIDDKSITGVLEAAGVDVDAARVKGLVASLASVDIEEAMSTAIAAPVAAAPAVGGSGGGSEAAAPVEEAAAEEEEEDDSGFEGLGSLFG